MEEGGQRQDRQRDLERPDPAIARLQRAVNLSTVVMVAMEKRERFEETLDPPVTVRMVMFKQRGISSPDLAATERAPPW